MMIESPPILPQLERAYRCPGCQAVVRFEEKDVAAPGGPKFRLTTEGWEAKMKCPWCHVMRLFGGVEARHDLQH